MPSTPPNPDPSGPTDPTQGAPAPQHLSRDIAEVPAIEVITTAGLHLMSAAAVKLGLGDQPGDLQHVDLDEARKLITALAGLVTATAADIGTFHAAPLRDALKTLQLAFREASAIPDPPGQGPGEALTGAVVG